MFMASSRHQFAIPDLHQLLDSSLFSFPCLVKRPIQGRQARLFYCPKTKIEGAIQYENRSCENNDS